MPDMLTSQRCKHIGKTRPGHGMQKPQRKSENKRSLKKQMTRLNGYPRKFVRGKKVAKWMKRRPMLRYDVGKHHSCASHRISCRASKGCAHQLWCREGQGDWPGPRFSGFDGGQVPQSCSFAYVKAAYCGWNPVSHPNPPPYPPCTALEPHCWASTLGSGR